MRKGGDVDLTHRRQIRIVHTDDLHFCGYLERLPGPPDLFKEPGEEDYSAGIKNVHQPVFFRLRSDHGRIGIVINPGTGRIPGIAEILCRGCCLYGIEGLTNIFASLALNFDMFICIFHLYKMIR